MAFKYIPTPSPLSLSSSTENGNKLQKRDETYEVSGLKA